MISFEDVWEALTLRHLAKPRPALSTEVKKVTKNKSPLTNFSGKDGKAERKVIMNAVGTASVKISFEIRFLSKFFFSLIPFRG